MPSAGPIPTLFINYRREDTAPHAGRLYDRLADHFGRDQVFMDIDHIEPGEDFVEAINRKVGGCDVAIVSIGPDWLTLTDPAGKRRLDDPEDFVRMEIVAALQRNIRVIPILVGGARMPRKQDLPEELAPLSRRNALEVSETRFHADVDRLIEAIEKPRTLPEKKGNAPPPAARLAAAQDGRGASAKPNYLRAAVISLIAIALIAGVAWFVAMRGSPDTPATAVSDEPAASDSESDSNAQGRETTPTAESAAEEEQPSLRTRLEQERAEEWRTIEDLYQPQKWLPTIRKNAEAGIAQAEFEMGIFYEFGLPNLEKDIDQAVEWYRKAAAQGHAVARQGVEDLTRADEPDSEAEIRKLDQRRQGRLQAILAHVYRGTDGKTE